MDPNTRKINVIEKVLKIKDDSLLEEIESLLKSTKNIQGKGKSRSKPSDFAGCISKEEVKNLLKRLSKS